MVRPFGTLGRKPRLGRAGMVGVLLASTVFVTVPKAEAAGELIEPSSGWIDLDMQQASGVSGDGTKVIGYGYDSVLGRYRPLLNTPDGVTMLATFGIYGEVAAINRAGDAMVGFVVGGSGFDRAAKWDAAGSVFTLGTLIPSASSARSYASDISGDGTRVVGYNRYAGMLRGFVWIEGATGGVVDNEQMYQLPGLPSAGRHFANAISDDGMFAVGQSDGNSHTGRAVRWDLSTIADDGLAPILDLGSLSGMGGSSLANDVSADGRVVVGEAGDADGNDYAFRWVEGSTTGVAGNVQMHNLGSLGGNFSTASAVSRDGSIVVGQASSQADDDLAFRWSEATGMESVAAWLARNDVDVGGALLLNARGVSDDGNVVVGGMTNAQGQARAYVARVAPGQGSGVMDVAEYNRSLFSTTQIAHAGQFLTWLPMNGSHHRPLMRQGSLSGDTCLWATGDLAQHGGTGTGLGLAEVGGCVDLFGGNVRAGLGVGTSHAWQALAFGGSNSLAGQYVVGEVDWQPDGTPLLLSLTGMLGGWQANIHRGYSNGATTAYSDGQTQLGGGVIRMRADWLEAATIGNTTINPWASVAVGRMDAAGYVESGGPFPARFDGQSLVSHEVRLGLTAVTEFSDTTTLSTTLEVAHRSGTAPAAKGNVVGLFDFSFGGGQQSQTWARIGADLDHQIGDDATISLSLNAATSGQDASVGGSVGVKAVF